MAFEKRISLSHTFGAVSKTNQTSSHLSEFEFHIALVFSIFGIHRTGTVSGLLLIENIWCDRVSYGQIRFIFPVSLIFLEAKHFHQRRFRYRSGSLIHFKHWQISWKYSIFSSKTDLVFCRTYRKSIRTVVKRSSIKFSRKQNNTKWHLLPKCCCWFGAYFWCLFLSLSLSSFYFTVQYSAIKSSHTHSCTHRTSGKKSNKTNNQNTQFNSKCTTRWNRGKTATKINIDIRPINLNFSHFKLHTRP